MHASGQSLQVQQDRGALVGVVVDGPSCGDMTRGSLLHESPAVIRGGQVVSNGSCFTPQPAGAAAARDWAMIALLIL
jgi:hypothetical protein